MAVVVKFAEVERTVPVEERRQETKVVIREYFVTGLRDQVLEGHDRVGHRSLKLPHGFQKQSFEAPAELELTVSGLAR